MQSAEGTLTRVSRVTRKGLNGEEEMERERERETERERGDTTVVPFAPVALHTNTTLPRAKEYNRAYLLHSSHNSHSITHFLLFKASRASRRTERKTKKGIEKILLNGRRRKKKGKQDASRSGTADFFTRPTTMTLSHVSRSRQNQSLSFSRASRGESSTSSFSHHVP